MAGIDVNDCENSQGALYNGIELMLAVVMNGDNSDFFFFLNGKISHDCFVPSLIYDEPINSIVKMKGLQHMEIQSTLWREHSYILPIPYGFD